MLHPNIFLQYANRPMLFMFEPERKLLEAPLRSFDIAGQKASNMWIYCGSFL